jgi:hypothetical protein
MKKQHFFTLGVIVVAVLLAGAAYLRQERLAQDVSDEQAVEAIVQHFGASLQQVSLSAPDALQEMAQVYAPYASPSLINEWQGNRSFAPGRNTSSPWPDRIEISSDSKQKDGSYLVQGTVVEVTSNEVAHGGIAADFPVTLTLNKFDKNWLITAYEAGPETIFASATTTATTTVH